LRSPTPQATRIAGSPAAGFLAKADLSGAALEAVLAGAGRGREPGR
jgi:hypothetical protein